MIFNNAIFSKGFLCHFIIIRTRLKFKVSFFQEFEETPNVETNPIKNGNSKVAMIGNSNAKMIKEEENVSQSQKPKLLTELL